jgi:hypothetical protein
MERENIFLRQLCALLLMVATTNIVYASQSDIDLVARSKVVNAIANKLEAEYVFPDIGKKMADKLRAEENEGKYEGIRDGGALSFAFTRHLRELSGVDFPAFTRHFRASEKTPLHI